MRVHGEQSLNNYGLFPMPEPGVGVVCRTVENVAVIDLSGSLVEEESVHHFHEKIRELLKEGTKQFAVNLTEVSRVDSYTLGGLAGAYNLIRHAGGRVKFFAASKQLIHTFNKLHLDRVFELFEDEASALSSFH